MSSQRVGDMFRYVLLCGNKHAREEVIKLLIIQVVSQRPTVSGQELSIKPNTRPIPLAINFPLPVFHQFTNGLSILLTVNFLKN